MEFGVLVGWIGVAFGVLVPIPQLIKILKKHKVDGVSVGTYILLFLAMACYLAHAIYIKSPVFITAQSFNLTTNGLILFLLLKK